MKIEKAKNRSCLLIILHSEHNQTIFDEHGKIVNAEFVIFDEDYSTPTQRNAAHVILVAKYIQAKKDHIIKRAADIEAWAIFRRSWEN